MEILLEFWTQIVLWWVFIPETFVIAWGLFEYGGLIHPHFPPSYYSAGTAQNRHWLQFIVTEHGPGLQVCLFVLIRITGLLVILPELYGFTTAIT